MCVGNGATTKCETSKETGFHSLERMLMAWEPPKVTLKLSIKLEESRGRGQKD